MVVYHFQNFYEWMFISINFLFIIEHVIRGQIFLYLHHPLLVLSVVCPLMKALGSSMLRISLCSTFFTIF